MGCLVGDVEGNQRKDSAKTKIFSLRMQMEGVFDGDVIALRQRTEAVDTLDGAHGGDVEGRGSTGGFDASVRGDTFAVDVEDDGGAFADGGARVGLCGVPVLGDLTVDDVDVVGEALAEGAVFH